MNSNREGLRLSQKALLGAGIITSVISLNNPLASAASKVAIEAEYPQCGSENIDESHTVWVTKYRDEDGVKYDEYDLKKLSDQCGNPVVPTPFIGLSFTSDMLRVDGRLPGPMIPMKCPTGSQSYRMEHTTKGHEGRFGFIFASGGIHPLNVNGTLENQFMVYRPENPVEYVGTATLSCNNKLDRTVPVQAFNYRIIIYS